MIEWDIGAYQRKFSGTIALMSSGDGPPQWTPIKYIEDNHFVYSWTGKCLGFVKCEYDGTGPVTKSDMDGYPLLNFHYAPIYPGLYWDKNEIEPFMVRKKHQKSYKIGLCNEAFDIRPLSYFHDWHKGWDTIDLTHPVVEHTFSVKGDWEVFSNKLVRIGTTLYGEGDRIGFMEGEYCVLRSDKFIPLIQQFLEGKKWQIIGF